MKTLSVLSGLVAALSWAQSPDETRRLELRAGESRAERVPLAAGQYVHVFLQQLGIDVAIAFIDPAGKRVHETDTPTGERGVEEISWIAEVSGDHVLEVRSGDSEAKPGQYEIRVEAPRPATRADRARIRAEALSAEGHQLGAAGDAESAQKGGTRLSAALALWREVGDRRGEALTLYGLGRISQQLRESEQAAGHYRAALSLWRALGDRNEEASTLFGLASMESVSGNVSEALRHYDEALRLENELGNSAMAAEVLTSLGSLRNVLGEKRKALEHYTTALPIMRASRDRTGELRVLNNLGYLYDFQGEEQKALDAYRQALEISRALKRKPAEAMVLGNLGRLYGELGDADQAFAYLQEALEIRRGLGDRGLEATVLLYIGQLFADRQEPGRAIEYYLRALPLLPPVENRRKEGAALISLGEAYLAVEEREKALHSFEQALTLARAAGDRYLEGDAMTNAAVARGSLGQMEVALQDLDRALGLRRDIGDRAGEAAIFFHRARLERTRGSPGLASRYAELSLDHLEAVRGQVSSRELRASYLATLREPYDLAIDLFMELHGREPGGGFAARALETSERARARSLLDQLAESHIDIREGAEPALVDRERAVRELLRGKLERQLRLASEKGEAAQINRVADEVRESKAEHEQVLAQIRGKNPRYAALTQPRPLSVAEIQRDVLDEETLLLEYALGKERSYLWTVTPTSLTGYQLPGRAEIEAAALRFHQSLAASPRGRDARSPSAISALSANLSTMLLAPAARELQNKRLLIAAEGTLQYVPFGALADPARPGTPLIVGHEVVAVPSASVLAVLRREVAGRQTAPRQLAVFADPIFDAEDQRLRQSGRGRSRLSGQVSGRENASGPERAATEAGRDAGMERLPRLLFSRREAHAILDLVPETQRFAAFDFAASREAVIDPLLSEYRFIHFATHGFFNTHQPELSGIVLSLVDREGRPRDGFLTAQDIFNLRLPADMVVLSACRTALGKEVRGEGLVGITRGFMYAGAPRVVASLWTVDDVATSELMKRFYAGMLGASHLAPAAALRVAQASLAATRRWSHPYYWAAFVLQGEWN